MFERRLRGQLPTWGCHVGLLPKNACGQVMPLYVGLLVEPISHELIYSEEMPDLFIEVVPLQVFLAFQTKP